MKLLADTGCPCAAIVSPELFDEFGHADAMHLESNFGNLRGAWFNVSITELSFDASVVGYVSESVVAAARSSDPDFGGLAGLPLLRLFEYGGDAENFWIRLPS